MRYCIDFYNFQEMKIHPKAVKGDKSQVGAPMPGTVLCKSPFLLFLTKVAWKKLLDVAKTAESFSC